MCKKIWILLLISGFCISCARSPDKTNGPLIEESADETDIFAIPFDDSEREEEQRMQRIRALRKKHLEEEKQDDK